MPRRTTPYTARLAHDQALGRVMLLLLRDDTQVYKQFAENPQFKGFVTNMVYALTSHDTPSPPSDIANPPDAPA